MPLTSYLAQSRIQIIGLLLLIFCSWKAVLMIVMLAAPGIGYDTSSSMLLVDLAENQGSLRRISQPPKTMPSILKLVRWDGIYFLRIVQRGYLFEQEWAFGPGFPTLVAFIDKRLYYLAHLFLAGPRVTNCLIFRQDSHKTPLRTIH